MADTYDFDTSMFNNGSFGLNNIKPNSFSPSLSPESFDSGLAKSLTSNSLSDYLLKNKMKTTAGSMTPSATTGNNENLFGFSNDQISGAADIGNVALGIANYFENRKMNKLGMQQTRLNIERFKKNNARQDLASNNFGKISANI